jgi:HEAT repeat protein
MIRSLVSGFCLAGLILTALPLRADDAEVEKLAKGLKAKKWMERVKAAEGLGKLGDKASGAARYLCEACADGTKEVRDAALEALEKVAPKLYKPVVALVVDNKVGNHVGASRELAKLGDDGKPAVPLLYEHVRFAIKSASVKDNPPASFPLTLTWQDGSTYFDTHFETLSKLAPDENTVKVIGSAANLELAARNPNSVGIMHRAAIQALKKLAESQEACRKPMVPVLIKALDSPAIPAVEKKQPFAMHNIAAIEALGACGPVAKDAIPALKKLKLDESEKVRKAATDALEKIDK